MGVGGGLGQPGNHKKKAVHDCGPHVPMQADGSTSLYYPHSSVGEYAYRGEHGLTQFWLISGLISSVYRMTSLANHA